MKISVIFTGGTIGSYVNGKGTISTMETVPYRLIDLYNNCKTVREKVKIKKMYNQADDKLHEQSEVEFVTHEPYKILSERLDMEHEIMLIRQVQDCIDKDDSDGIIITHGTDTLQYSAAFLHYVFYGAGIPIVLVSSNYVLDDECANGLTNFMAAIDFIKLYKSDIVKMTDVSRCNVFVSYCNRGDVPYIHFGHRLANPFAYTDRVESIQDSWVCRGISLEEKQLKLGSYGEEKNRDFNYAKNVSEGFELNHKLFGVDDRLKNICVEDKLSDTVHSEMKYFIKNEKNGQCKNICLGKEILRLQAYPEMVYPDDKRLKNVVAILHESYHSGTINVSLEFENFMKLTDKLGIKVYLTGLSSFEKEYETVDVYRKKGVEILYDKAPIAQYCKLLLEHFSWII